MTFPAHPLSCSSRHLEQAVLARYRQLAPEFPPDCRLHREIWNRSTVLCLDCGDCPQSLGRLQTQLADLLALAARFHLAQAISLRLGQKAVAWQTAP
ncbi:MAG: hypothetical protein GC158_04115 [Cyanobacteria bacterium RI_101]|nr:hypothetical protein [Cyanobacteria bacterium RI_101]MEB3174376.1 hypothetical protein [Cyanobacteriota bacterium]